MGEDYSIPIYEPTGEAGERYTKKRKQIYEERFHGPGWRVRGTPEKRPCPTDIWWHQYDTDVLELARLLSVWYGKGELKRPFYEVGIYRVKLLLGLYNFRDPVDGRLKWKIRKDWQRRLIQAGIDPVTFQIKDINRWSRVWEMLKCEYRCNLELIEQEILDGVPAPPYKPFTWSQSLKASSRKWYNEYGPKPKEGDKLVARSWVREIGSKVGVARTETDQERRQRMREAGRPNIVATAQAIPLTEQTDSH